MFFETLVEVTYNIISPLFLLVGIVVLVDRIFEIDPRPLSRLVIYLFTPFLIFETLATTQLTAGEAGSLMGIGMGMCLTMSVIATLVARTLQLDPRTRSAFVLTATLINAGNYGIPLNQFAFGQPGEERAVVFFVGTVIITYTLGVYLASSGSASPRQALMNVVRVPMPYAVAAGLLVNVTDFEMPTPAARTTTLLAQAAVPGMLVVLGLQLRRARVRGHLRPILTAAGLRLVVGPLVGLALGVVIGVSGLSRQVSIVQSAMPTAVITSILAMEFGADDEFVTSTILVSTLLSIVTLSVTLALVM